LKIPLARAHDPATYRWYPCPLIGTCDTARLSNLAFYRVLASITTSSSFWCGVRLLSFVFQIQFLGFLLLIFVIHPFRKKNYFFNLVLKLQFIIYYFFQFITYSFDFLFFFLNSFVKNLLVFNFIIKSKFM